MTIPRLLALAFGAILLSAAALAHQEHPGDQQSVSARSSPPALTRGAKDKGTPDARSYFTDTVLLDQNGRKVRFYSDVLKNRVVLLNVIYTQCKACPSITSRLKQVRHALGGQADNVYFITLTSDPKNDTPQALKAYARKYGVDKRNWIFLTGGEEQLALVLSRLGMPVRHLQALQEHSTVLIAGDVANRHWTKLRADASPKAIAQHLQLMTMPVAGR